MVPRMDPLGVSDKQSGTLPLSDCSVTCNDLVPFEFVCLALRLSENVIGKKKHRTVH